MHEEEMAVALLAILCLFGFGCVAVRYCYFAFKAWFDSGAESSPCGKLS